MPLVFRGVTKRLWNRQKHKDEYDWLSAGEIPAETLVDVVREDIKSNELSVYVINEDETHLQRLIAAFVANRQRPDELSYKLVDLEKLQQLGFEFKESPGNTPDSVINSWHRDLCPLTTNKLMKFVELLYFEAESKRALKKDVERWILDSVKQKHIDIDQIKEVSMLEKIEELRKKYA